MSAAWSLSARRAWIEISTLFGAVSCPLVALRKESVDRNPVSAWKLTVYPMVALRKESVDRNSRGMNIILFITASLSARRAWIEILLVYLASIRYIVALRK